MKGRILGTYEVHSPQWFAAREGCIGGSEIAAVMGWSPYGTRADLLAEKLDPQHKPSTKSQDRGTRLEVAILGWLLDRHTLTLDPEASAATWRHDVLPWATYSPDGIATTSKGGTVLLECKTTADRTTEKGWGRAGTDAVPLHYRAQVTWGLGLLGLERCYLGVLAGGVNGRPSLDFATYTVPFRADLYSRLLQGAALFIAELTAARKAAA